MHRFLTVLCLSAALAGSAAARADDHGSDHQTKRYYDKGGRDYHEWNQNENQAYHKYVNENHKRDREFAKTNNREKQDYFKWRHSHQDENGR